MARLGLDMSGFANGLAKADLAAKKAGQSISSSLKGGFAAAFGTAAIAAGVKNVLDFGGKISDLSKRTFLSKRALQEFDYIADQTGTTLEAFAMAEQKLAKAQQAALEGNKEMVANFASFGLKVRDLKRLDPHQLFRLLASSIGNTNLTGKQLTTVLELMGKSAGDLIPAMKEGFDGMIERAHKLGLILSDEVIDKLDEVGDRLGEAKLRMRKPAAGLAMFGVQKLEEGSAMAAGISAVWDELKMGLNAPKRSLASVYGDAVDTYNQQVMDSIGSKSLVPLLKSQLQELREIKNNQKTEALDEF